MSSCDDQHATSSGLNRNIIFKDTNEGVRATLQCCVRYAADSHFVRDYTNATYKILKPVQNQLL